jgi:hypothetical protein
MSGDRKIGNKYVVHNRMVYRSYPAMGTHSTKRCLVDGASYNQKFGTCIRKLECSEKGNDNYLIFKE